MKLVPALAFAAALGSAFVALSAPVASGASRTKGSNLWRCYSASGTTTGAPWESWTRPLPGSCSAPRT